MENYTLIDSYDTGDFPEVTVETYAILNPHWNRRLAELAVSDEGFKPFEDFLISKEYLRPEILRIKRGLKSDRYYIRCLYF